MKTISDIAKEAGVSVSTVSKVLNGRKDVSERTRRKVLEIAEKSDYFPNYSAVQLVRGQVDTIGVVFSNLGHADVKEEFILKLISGIYNRAEFLGYRILMFTAQYAVRRNQNYLQFCRSNNLKGLIIHGLESTDPQLEKLISSEVPSVFIDIDANGPLTSTISVDNQKACEQVVDRLATLHHQHIVFISGSDTSSVSFDRIKGFEKGAARNAIPKTAVLHADYTKEMAYQKAREYLFTHPDITAFFCASDLMAVGALNACMELGYQVPADISVVGFDNQSFTEHVSPKLSTVDQNFFEMGKQSVDLLILLSSGKKTENRYFVPYTILFRESIAKSKYTDTHFISNT